MSLTKTNPEVSLYKVGYTISPRNGLAAGTFTFSQTPPPNENIQFSCNLYNALGDLINTLQAQSTAITSAPLLISGLTGTELTAKLNFSASGMADVEIPLDFNEVGGLSVLSEMNIDFSWYDMPDEDNSFAAGLLKRRDSGDPVQSYLTGFDETGMFNFLSYIPWMDTHFIVAQPPTQNNQYALSGSYSCQFNAGVLGDSYIDTIDLPVPSGSTHVTISFAILLLQGGEFPLGEMMTLDYYENGNKTSSADVSIFNKEDINGWYNQQFSYTLSSLAVSTFKIMLSLNTTGHLGGVLTLDNLAINFMTNPPEPTDKMMVYSDESGSLYGLDAYSGQQKWVFTGQSDFLSSSIFILDGAAYVADGNTQSNVYSVNVNTGKKIWQTPLQGSMYCEPVLSDNLLIAGCSNGYLYALNKETGSIEWNIDFNPPKSGNDIGNSKIDEVNGVAADNHGLIYVATNTGIFAMNTKMQQSLWYHSTPQLVPFAPVLTEQEVIYGDVSGNIVCLDKISGSVKWNLSSSAPINSQPYLIGGIVIFGNDGGQLCGYNVETGEQVWSLEFPGTMIRSFNVDGPYLYFTANEISAFCYCYSYRIDQNQKWTFVQQWKVPASFGAQCSPLIAHDMVYYTMSDRDLYALSKSSGTEIWKFNSGRIGFASPAVVAPKPIDVLSFRYDQYCFLVAHNAYANVDDGWTFAQQTHNIIEQLDMGARGLELDIYRRTVSNVSEVVYDHSGLGNWKIFLSAPWKLLKDSLSEIKTWMDNHKDEVLTIIFEQPDFQNPDPMITKAFTDSGIADYVYYANKINTGKNGSTWNNKTQGWPTLQWMVDNGKRLVVFSQKGRGNTTGFAYLWDYAVENEYGTPSILSGCEKRSESDDLNKNTGKLFVVNYALNMPAIPATIPMPSTYTLTNKYDWLLAKLRSCQDVSANKALPNLVKVNFFEYGASGGPLRVVQEINKEWGH